MKQLLRPCLVNSSFGDPLVFCPFGFAGRSFAFDMGVSLSLSNSQLQSIDELFISHAHMDHVFGFEHFLRANLKENRTIRIFGPEGIEQIIHSKLTGFSWNLVHGYGLEFLVTTLGPTHLITHRFQCKKGFRPQCIDRQPLAKGWVYPIHTTPFYRVRSTTLDHRLSCQAYAVTESLTTSVNRDALDRQGYTAGSWLEDLKQLALTGTPIKGSLEVPMSDGSSKRLAAHRLADQLLIDKDPMTVAYVTDTSYKDDNKDKILELVADADHLFCEAPFLDRDREKATMSHHLTATQTGRLARLANVRRLTIFHFSKKYLNNETDLQALIREVEAAYGQAVHVDLHYVPYHAHRKSQRSVNQSETEVEHLQ